ncbi:lipopolysaccharide biosynthesis protein [Ulvibacterium sp.]|uniref:lipopolysaccharide biosynthesis protein n=1 Tax=Ulvibacterium sp. TaxID=2665914 RepID=UPI003CC57343
MLISKVEFSKLISILLDQGFTSIVSFYTTVVISRVSSISDYAEFVLLMSISVSILGFQRALISQPYIINRNDFKIKEAKEYFYSNLWFKSIFTLALVVLIPSLIWIDKSIDSSRLILLFTSFIIFYSSFYFVKDMLLGNRETLLNLKFSLFVNFSLAAILSYILIKGEDKISFFLIGASVVYLLAYVFFNLRNRSFLKFNRSKLLTMFKLNWKVGKWIAGSNLLFTVSSQIYPWLLLWFMSKSDIAIYGVLISISSLVNPILASLKAYLLPIFSKTSRNKFKLKKLVLKWVVFFCTMSFCLILVGELLGEQIIELFFGKKYSGLGYLVLLPFLDQAISILFQPLDIAFNALKRTDIGFRLLIFRSACALVLGFILVKQFGLVGVFATRISENILYQCANLVLFKRIMKT